MELRAVKLEVREDRVRTLIQDQVWDLVLVEVREQISDRVWNPITSQVLGQFWDKLDEDTYGT